MAVPTAIASNAMSRITETMPRVSARYGRRITEAGASGSPVVPAVPSAVVSVVSGDISPLSRLVTGTA